jgi:hypothetical protein
VFYDFGIKLKLIINGVKLLPKITFFIKGHFFMTFTSSLLLENVRPNKLRPKNSDPLKIKIKKTENHNLEPFQLQTGYSPGTKSELFEKKMYTFFPINSLLIRHISLRSPNTMTPEKRFKKIQIKTFSCRIFPGVKSQFLIPKKLKKKTSLNL